MILILYSYSWISLYYLWYNLPPPPLKKKLHSFWSLWLYGLLVLLLPRALHLSVSKFLHHLLPPPPSSADPMASNAICMPTPRYFYPLSSLHQSLQALRIASPPPMLVYRTSPEPIPSSKTPFPNQSGHLLFCPYLVWLAALEGSGEIWGLIDPRSLHKEELS